MLKKLSLYLQTVKCMKVSQIWHRLRKKMRLSCSLGVQPAAMPERERISPIFTLQELDFDPVFLARFPAQEFLAGRITFLYEVQEFGWFEKWCFPNHSSLWNFNVHYFEYLFSLIQNWKYGKNPSALEQIKTCIRGWIDSNPQNEGGSGWESYTIAMRLVNWLGCYAALETEIWKDWRFAQRMIASIYEQYVYLSNHLEKDLLANHYFADLEALILCAIFFNDEKILKAAQAEFRNQCAEQILQDGMHCELSPMYHKIVFEGVLRVAAVLRHADMADKEIEAYIQPMLNAAYSLEEGLERVPLFNDCGDNVAKSLNALALAAKRYFGLVPEYKEQLPSSGYYMFKQGEWKLIVDAGAPGLRYNPGHAHCDAMSFELFRKGKPVLVNCGTYAYQCPERSYFRSTAAHNTVQAEGVEQSQCWGVFRLGKRSSVRVIQHDDRGIEMLMHDQKGTQIQRRILFETDTLLVEDYSNGCRLNTYVHILDDLDAVEKNTWRIGLHGRLMFECSETEIEESAYAADYGKKQQIMMIKAAGEGISMRICFNDKDK